MTAADGTEGALPDERREPQADGAPPAGDPPSSGSSAAQAESAVVRRLVLPRRQPARALAAAALYLVTLVALAGLLMLRTSGWGLAVGTALVAVGTLVPFVLLGQRPGAPSRVVEGTFPRLGRPGDRRPDSRT